MSNDIIVLEEILGYVLEALDVIEVGTDHVCSLPCLPLARPGLVRIETCGDVLDIAVDALTQRLRACRCPQNRQSRQDGHCMSDWKYPACALSCCEGLPI